LAAEQKATEAIGHRERLAVQTITCLQLPLNIRRPHIIGGCDERARFPGMADVPPIAWLRHQTVAAQNITHSGACGPGPVGMAFPKDREQLLGPPGRMPLACLDDGADDLLGSLMGAAARLARALLEAVGAQPQIALDPLITCFATHTV
jgi:hypothetical protein